MRVAIRSVCSRQTSASEKYGVNDVSAPSALNGAQPGPGLNRIDPRASHAVMQLEIVRPNRGLAGMNFATVARSVRMVMFPQRISTSQDGSPCAAPGPFSHMPAQHIAGRQAASAARSRKAASLDFRPSPKDRDHPAGIAMLMHQRSISTDHLRDRHMHMPQSPPHASRLQLGVIAVEKLGYPVGTLCHRRYVPVTGVRHHE